MYGMNNSGKSFDDEYIYWLPESYFIQSQCQIYIYYKYAPYGKKMLSYIMLMTVYIGILMKLLENGLLIL